MTRLIVGCGYLGRRVARRWRAEGDDIVVTTRSAERTEELAREGLRTIVADVTKPATLGGLPAAETALFAVGYDKTSGKSLDEVYVSGLQNVLHALPAATGRLLYVSTTGVYGDRQGGWVDESSPCRPTRPGGRACLAAEAVLAAHPLGARSIVLRLAGLYGPGRIPRRDAIVAGEPVAAPSEGSLNLIHVDDAVEVVLAAAATTLPLPRTYLVADGHPCSRGEYYEELARLSGGPPPRFVRPESGAPATERAAADKRISNARLLAELGVTLRFPSYREGLASIVAAEQEAAP